MKRKDNNPELDALLRTQTQQAIQKAVRSLPEENLSLAWRSSLNERLRAAKPEPRWKARLKGTWRPALGLALASCLAITLTLRNPISHPVVANSSLEASLVATYDDTANSETVAGPGLAIHEVNDTTSNTDSSSDWSESDLNSL